MSPSDIQFPAHVRSKFLNAKYIKILHISRDHIHGPRIFQQQKFQSISPHSCDIFLVPTDHIFERKVYRRILGPVYDNEKENWRILTNKQIYAIVKKPTITETISLHRLCWFGHVQRMKENRIPKRVLYMNLESTRPRYRWQDEVREDGRIVGGEEWQEKVYNRKEW
jgi:hypothetical protein